jgi:hypothetical protein
VKYKNVYTNYEQVGRKGEDYDDDAVERVAYYSESHRPGKAEVLE